MSIVGIDLAIRVTPDLGVGNTPLLALPGLTSFSTSVRIYAKAEWFNPGGSIKDRPALRMIQRGLETGRLTSGRTILDATSGNTGIAYAWIGARLGYRVLLTVSSAIHPEREKILRESGAELILTDPMAGSDGAILKAREIYALDPHEYFYPDQYNNPENWRAHYDTTGPEILAQTGNSVTHFIAGLGTGGTFRGTGSRLRAEIPSVRLVAVQPDSPLHGIEGLKHMESSIVPGVFDPFLADENMSVRTEDAQAMVARIGIEDDLRIGVSGAANLVAAARVARREQREGRHATIVTVIPDDGRMTAGAGANGETQ